MRKRQSAALRPGILWVLLLLFATSFGTGCRKASKADPCDGMLNEGSPIQVAFLFMDGRTGENVLLSKNVDIAAITITSVPSDLYFEPGIIIKQPGSPLHGALLFHVADTKKGDFNYKIDIGGDNVTLSYTNQELKSDNPCKPYTISLINPVITGRPFTLSRLGARLTFTVTL